MLVVLLERLVDMVSFLVQLLGKHLKKTYCVFQIQYHYQVAQKKIYSNEVYICLLFLIIL